MAYLVQRSTAVAAGAVSLTVGDAQGNLCHCARPMSGTAVLQVFHIGRSFRTGAMVFLLINVMTW